MSYQFGALSLFEATGDVTGVNDEPISKTVVPDDPVAAVIERAQFDAALGKTTAGDPAWDALLGSTPAPDASAEELQKRARLDFVDIERDAKLLAKRMTEEWNSE